MRRNRRKRAPIINQEERKAALKQLGYGSFCFFVLLAVFAGKEALLNGEPEYTANIPSNTTTIRNHTPSPSVTTSTTPSYSATITINQKNLDAARELAKTLSQTPAPVQTTTHQSNESQRAKHVLDGQ